MSAPPPPELLGAVYGVFGLVLSFAITHALPVSAGGRTLGHIAVQAHEWAPFGLVCALFVMYYELYDVMGAGVAQLRAIDEKKLGDKKFPVHNTCPEKLPSYVLHAQRAQVNQVEQAPLTFLLGGLATLMASSAVAAVLVAVWAVVRAMYSMAYRKGSTSLGSYTVPAYMVNGALAGLVTVHSVRLLLSGPPG
uniref:Uncharacterized protein n=1 Tax=Chromera velia CCMP2878 TaxID=1169474 RepID=A0A0G4FQ96_9ALVE|mmetsp:Transcript_21583/g.42898  ORF Transcript_21583/g.42898 Transcript_21583/m.42898 type:complete len:193 (+) Transcript_21583:171-749(+)|eukprot:Cvel_3607.t1-p1 / transcript=Cvel_3607.t1 / gene=Cvel_3607 / organism=Chromera_velia_CCMP2878 / gene_product=hypothetical protein / transcript_product=hypothetical protein / location=Cvel_scaffold148:21668-22243(+) / protein_length=192 / sequence_SO=supercontig / SO=protein_coding / is_pseudo=false